jgi:hypothetical protein
MILGGKYINNMKHIQDLETFTTDKLNEEYKPLKDKEAVKYVGKTIKEFYISASSVRYFEKILKIKFEDGSEMMITAYADHSHNVHPVASLTID